MVGALRLRLRGTDERCPSLHESCSPLEREAGTQLEFAARRHGHRDCAELRSVHEAIRSSQVDLIQGVKGFAAELEGAACRGLASGFVEEPRGFPEVKTELAFGALAEGFDPNVEAPFPPVGTGAVTGFGILLLWMDKQVFNFEQISLPACEMFSKEGFST